MSFKNFTAADRKRNMYDFGMFPVSRDLSWIADNLGNENPTIATVPFSSTPQFDIANGRVQRITLTGDVTSSTILQNGGLLISEGAQFWLQVLQDATGGRTFIFPNEVRNAAGFSVGSEPNVMTTMYLQYRSGGWDFIMPPVQGPVS